MLTFGTDILLISRNYAYDPNRGNSTVEIYQGTPAAIQSLANQVSVNPYVSWSISDNEKPAWLLTIQTPDDVSYQTIWEVAGNDLSKSLYEHENVIAAGATDVSKLREYFKHANESDAMPTGMTADAQEAFSLLKKDTTHFFKPQYVLRSRIIGTLEGFSGAVFSLSSVGLVFAPAKLLPGGTYDVHMPAPIAEFVRQCSVVNTESASNYTWGWLFKTPTITGLPGGKFELRQEWWLELWSDLLYDAAA